MKRLCLRPYNSMGRNHVDFNSTLSCGISSVSVIIEETVFKNEGKQFRQSCKYLHNKLQVT